MRSDTSRRAPPFKTYATTLACAGFLSAFAVASSSYASAGGVGTERKALQRSWSDTCKQYDSQTQYAALEACNLQWFHDHEKAVWQLNLNPHNAITPIPPPS